MNGPKAQPVKAVFKAPCPQPGVNTSSRTSSWWCGVALLSERAAGYALPLERVRQAGPLLDMRCCWIVCARTGRHWILASRSAAAGYGRQNGLLQNMRCCWIVCTKTGCCWICAAKTGATGSIAAAGYVLPIPRPQETALSVASMAPLQASQAHQDNFPLLLRP